MSANPKETLASAERKARLDLLEPVAEREIAAALEFGAITKDYGVRNFAAPGTEIRLRVYIAAMKRHLDALLDGENCAPDSGVHHLGHVGASVHVVLKAMQAGTVVDDRDPQLDALRDEMEYRDTLQTIEEAGRTPPPGVYDSACCHDPVVRCPACA